MNTFIKKKIINIGLFEETMSEITSVEIDRTEGIDSKVSIRSSGVEELKRFACKIERRGGKGKKGIADEKTLFVSKVAGNFFQLPFEREKDPPRGGEGRRKDDFNFQHGRITHRWFL